MKFFENDELKTLRSFKKEIAELVGVADTEYLGRIVNGVLLLLDSERMYKRKIEEIKKCLDN